MGILEEAEFQLTHSRGVRQRINGMPDAITAFQLTHSRGVRRNSVCSSGASSKFQLTHSRGVRQTLPILGICLTPFQLTHSRGVRLVFRHDRIFFIQISTHALTWSATYTPYSIKSALNFNSRTHVECDDLSNGIANAVSFQLTHSRGVRQGCTENRHETPDFNSRTHVECD